MATRGDYRCCAADGCLHSGTIETISNASATMTNKMRPPHEDVLRICLDIISFEDESKSSLVTRPDPETTIFAGFRVRLVCPSIGVVSYSFT